MKRAFSIIVMIAAFVAIQCGPEKIAGGGTIETTNGRITGVVKSVTSVPVESATVLLIPATYDPVKGKAALRSCTTTTDGCFAFSNVDSGNYNLRATIARNIDCALLTGIDINKDTVNVEQMTLLPATTVILPVEAGVNLTNGYFYVPGTALYVSLRGSSGRVTLDSVPAGIIPSIRYSEVNSNVSITIRNTMSVGSHDTITVHNFQWLYAKRLYLNTTPAGAAITGTVLHFPVLIRLSSSNFVFSQAQESGADIRFTKADNTFLHYEIERWDMANQRAEIWVNVDTVFGNDSMQHIFMYWGNAQAADSSHNTQVFDTANGFIGVWHMNEASLAGTASVKDRTVNAYHAMPMGSMTVANSVEGAIGKALTFNGTKDYLNAEQVSISAQYSMGLWVFLNTVEKSQRFIWKDSSYTMWYDTVYSSIRMEHMSATTWWRGLFQDGGSKVSMTKGEWCFLSASYDGASMRLYKNGVEVSVSNVISVNPVTTDGDLLFGKYKNIDYVNGNMDEIRIESTVRSPDWMKLCYINQQADNVMITFR